jgi:hypothetical protein
LEDEDDEEEEEEFHYSSVPVDDECKYEEMDLK